MKYTKSIQVFYHGHCRTHDGFTGAWAAWKKFGARAQYEGLLRDNTLPEPKGKTIYFVDFCPDNTAYLKRLVKNNRKVVLIDHHRTSEHYLHLFTEYLYDTSHSGATLAWRYFHPKKPVPMLLRCVESNDIFKRRVPHVNEITITLDTHTEDFKEWSRIVRAIENPSTRKQVVAQGTLLLQYRDALVRSTARKARLVKFEGTTALAVNCGVNELNDDVAILLYRAYPPMAIVWRFDGPNLAVSLRSTPKKNVRVLAEKYGGGGHDQAAGFAVMNAKKLPWTFVKVTKLSEKSKKG
jgi:uncharacterized protein